jgi:4-amino-4-deoxy-L-arabinose transferase-like glycosyltransferase
MDITKQSSVAWPPGDLEARQADAAWAMRAGIVLLIAAAVRVAFILWAPLDLSGDEAQYWDWSRKMQWCYFSKGPAVAACIWLARQFLGETVLAVRAPAVVLSAANGLAIFLLGRRLYNARVGFKAAVLSQIVPLFAAFGIGMTADPPFLLCWTLALLFLHRAATAGRLGDWLALGAILGLGLLSKYTMALFYPLAFCYLLAKPHRRRLLQPGPWLAAATGLLFLAPLLAWNAQNDWVNFRHNIGHTGVNESPQLLPVNLLEFLAAQLAIITPVLAIMMLWAVIRQRKSDPLSFWFCLPFLAFFTLKSLQGHDYANWTLVGYVTGLVAFAGAFLQRPASNVHVRRLVRAAWLTPAIATPLLMLLVALGHFAYLLDHAGPPFGVNPYRKFTGWAETGRAVQAVQDRQPDPGRCFVVGSTRLTTASLAFYIPGQPRVFQMADQKIDSQYDLWPGYENRIGQDAICIVDNRHPKREHGRPAPPGLNAAFRSQFARVDPPIYPVANDAHGRPIELCAIYVCHNFLGPGTRPTTAPDDVSH